MLVDCGTTAAKKYDNGTGGAVGRVVLACLWGISISCAVRVLKCSAAARADVEGAYVMVVFLVVSWLRGVLVL